MNLNKNGWGTTEMLLLSGGLLIALIVSIYFISELYGSFDKAVGNRHYVDLETKLESAARDYIKDKNIEVNGEYNITVTSLIESNYIDDFKDPYNSDCDGYVKITNQNGIIYYSGYISCKNYQTNNY